MKKFSKRAILIGAGAVVGYAASKALRSHLPVYDGTTRLNTAAAKNILNDASGLSPTQIFKHHVIKADASHGLIARLRKILKEAKRDRRPVNIGAARHSMGGQAIPRNGIAITFDNPTLELDRTNQSYLVHAGARWSQVIGALDPVGFSPKVMQSNNDFGVAATYSVNAHGWPVPFGPMGATVKALRIVLPDGTLVRCARDENADLFGLAMGGYGLIGLIVDLEVEMVPNTRLTPNFQTMEAEDFATAFQAVLKDPEVSMAYGRLNVDRNDFFSHALLVSYRETENQDDLPAVSGSGVTSHIASRLYRAQLGNEPVKNFRWWIETAVGPTIGGGAVTRNSLINEPVATLDDRNPDRTDILHEYFIGFDNFVEFLEICREVIPASYQEFLNVTLRYVAQDKESTLSYATVPRIAAVMSFSQELTQRAEADMTRMTQVLIDRISAIGGAYYLPYRPHARLDQFTTTYANAEKFAQAKRQIDPDLILRNNLWDTYLEKL